MFHDDEISLSHPEEHGRKNGHNIINILIRGNGTSKTKLVEYIIHYITKNLSSENAKKSFISGNQKSSCGFADS